MNRQLSDLRPWNRGSVGGLALYGEMAKFQKRSLSQRLRIYNQFYDSVRMANAAIERMMKP